MIGDFRKLVRWRLASGGCDFSDFNNPRWRDEICAKLSNCAWHRRLRARAKLCSRSRCTVTFGIVFIYYHIHVRICGRILGGTNTIWLGYCFWFDFFKGGLSLASANEHFFYFLRSCPPNEKKTQNNSTRDIFHYSPRARTKTTAKIQYAIKNKRFPRVRLTRACAGARKNRTKSLLNA